ncbi:recombinase XerD [Clostridia bacterium]|nr:recombinase XerD [Clostridia bacterium]
MANKNLSYHESLDRKNVQKLRKLLEILPPYTTDFFRELEPRTSSRTRIAYAHDLKVFFFYLVQELPAFQDKTPTQITLEELAELKAIDLEKYLEYLKYYQQEQTERTNKEQGLMRKLSSLKSFFRYFYLRERIKKDPTILLSRPKFYPKDIIRLDTEEVSSLLDEAEYGSHLSKQQKFFHQKTKLRDVALLSLLLGTGIRVSECIGLDLNDLDQKNKGIRIRRKGGKETVIYFSEEVDQTLSLYLEQRKLSIPVKGHENALFLSLQKKRLAVRTVENLVKKYAELITPLKRITPHKLRSTYGTNLYRQTGDIYLVADILGHADVNTTKAHYAALEESRKKEARNAVKLRV